MDKGPFVDIIILNFNQEPDTVECILSLKKMSYTNYRIILVDNGSADGSGKRIKEKFSEIELLRSGENLGFSGGCNYGIRHSLKSGLAGYVLLLNNDTKVNENLLTALLAVAQKDNRIGIAGALEFYYSQPDRLRMAGSRFIWWLGGHVLIRSITSEFKEVQYVSGCCMLIKKEVIEKIGLLDERFFAYYEDADFCLRARCAGFKVAAARDAKVWHKVTKVLGVKNPREYYIYTRNQPLFVLKNCPKIFLVNYFAVYFLKVFARLIYFPMTLRRDIAVAIFEGLADFFRGNFGKGRLFNRWPLN